MDGLVFDRLEGEEVARPEESFSVKKAVLALFDLSDDKARGLDGYSLAFWQSSWDLVKEKVMGFFHDFHEHGRFVRSLNSTFLVLVPKKRDVEDLRDYRLISLVGGLYKLLANRLKQVVGKVVFSSQNVFVERRQILASLTAPGG